MADVIRCIRCDQTAPWTTPTTTRTFGDQVSYSTPTPPERAMEGWKVEGAITAADAEVRGVCPKCAVNAP